MTPVMVSFSRVLPKVIKASRPNSFFRPVIGLSLLKSGASFDGVNIRPVCMTLPKTPSAIDAPMTISNMGMISMTTARAMPMPPSPSSDPRSWSGCARKGSRSSLMVRHSSGPLMATMVQAPISDRACGRSPDLATSPLSRACWSFRPEASSVLSSPSASSATAGSLQKDA